MIKRITLLVAIVAISTATFAQMQFGVKGGLNMANIKISGGGMSISNKMNMGFLVGGFASFSINDKMAFQPEVLFAQYGCKLSQDLTGADSDLKEVINYLSIPLMVKYSLGSINILAGPQLGYMLSAKFDGEDDKDSWNSLDYGIAVGAGYEMESGLGLDLRYYLGLANIGKDTGDATVKNSSIQIAVSYKFK